MKSDIHPAYGPVVFRDRSAYTMFLTRSTLAAGRAGGQTVRWADGQDYPVVDLEISAASHPFWTGRRTVLDTEGRVERFRRRYGGAAAGNAAEDAR